MCVYCHMSKKSRVGRSGLIFFFFFFFIDKTGNSLSHIFQNVQIQKYTFMNNNSTKLHGTFILLLIPKK
jgi:hypothetical protein